MKFIISMEKYQNRVKSVRNMFLRKIQIPGMSFSHHCLNKVISAALLRMENPILFSVSKKWTRKKESFEWLLLSTDLIQEIRVSQILEHPEDYIDSREYASWERFFTKLLVSRTQGDPLWAYSKKKLPDIYLSSKIMNAVKKQMRLLVWEKKERKSNN